MARKANTCTNEMFDVHSIPSIETAVQDTRVHKVNCFTPLPKLCDSSLEFIVPASSENIDLYNSYLVMHIQIVKKGDNGYVPIADDLVTPIHLLGLTMFNQIEVKINNEVISELNPYYHYQSYISAVCNLSEYGLENQLGGAMADLDQAGFYHVMDPLVWANNTEEPPAEYYPWGAEERYKKISKGKVAEIVTPIFSDLFKVPRVLPPNTEVRIALHLNRPEFLLNTDVKGVHFNISIQDATFYVPKYRLHEQALEAQKRALKLKPALYPGIVQRTKTFTLQEGETSLFRSVVHNSTLPRRAFVAIVNRSAFDGKFDQNPMSFRPQGLNELYFQIDDKKYPMGIGYTPDFKSPKYYKDYIMFIKELNFKNSNPIFDYNSWRFDMNIYCAQFCQDHSFGCSYGNEPMHGNLDLKINFSAPLIQSCVVLVVLEFSRMLSISPNAVEWKDI